MRERETALVHSASLDHEDGSVFMSMAHGTGYGTKVLKSITWTTRRHQCDSMTITVRIKQGFGCQDHHGQPNARHLASTMSCGQHPMRQWLTDLWSMCHMNERTHPAASSNRPGKWSLISLKWGQSVTQWSSSPIACVLQTVHR